MHLRSHATLPQDSRLVLSSPLQLSLPLSLPVTHPWELAPLRVRPSLCSPLHHKVVSVQVVPSLDLFSFLDGDVLAIVNHNQ